MTDVDEGMSKSMKRILITGAAGSIGSELYRQLAPDNIVMAFDNNETGLFDLHEEYRLKGHEVHYRLGDVRDQRVVDATFDAFQPQIVFHAAALKHVTPNEKYPREAVKTNVCGTLNVLGATLRHNARMINISTDKAVNSTCVMGITKRLGEVCVRNAGQVSVRFGNVMRSRGSVLEIWERQLANNEPLTITDERMERFMMSIPQACQLLIQASQVGKPGEILILDMGERIKITDLAEKFLADHNRVGYPISIIGVRPGEQLSERLMTNEEELTAVRGGNFIIIK